MHVLAHQVMGCKHIRHGPCNIIHPPRMILQGLTVVSSCTSCMDTVEKLFASFVCCVCCWPQGSPFVVETKFDGDRNLVSGVLYVFCGQSSRHCCWWPKQLSLLYGAARCHVSDQAHSNVPKQLALFGVEWLCFGDACGRVFNWPFFPCRSPSPLSPSFHSIRYLLPPLLSTQLHRKTEVASDGTRSVQILYTSRR